MFGGDTWAGTRRELLEGSHEAGMSAGLVIADWALIQLLFFGGFPPLCKSGLRETAAAHFGPTCRPWNLQSDTNPKPTSRAAQLYFSQSGMRKSEHEISCESCWKPKRAASAGGGTSWSFGLPSLSGGRVASGWICIANYKRGGVGRDASSRWRWFFHVFFTVRGGLGFDWRNCVPASWPE